MDIIVEHRSQGLKRVSVEHPSLMALQYPLMFLYDEDGYQPHISYATESPWGKKLTGILSPYPSICLPFAPSCQ